MRFFHLSDLHIGKLLHSYNMREDQLAILSQVIKRAEELHPDAVLIAGDIYDRSAPSAEAVALFDQFLTGISNIRPIIPVLIISGNHDSAERLQYASTILDKYQIHIAGTPPADGDSYLKKVVLSDAYGEVCFYLLPFIKPAHVRNIGLETGERIESYGQAVRKLIERETIDTSIRNVILSHQFYTAGTMEPERRDSEAVMVGGIENVDISVLRDFDYAALGHIHKSQPIGNQSRYYCGTLLKYSVSEYKDEKSLTLVELKEKGTEPVISQIPLHPLRDLRKEKGKLEEILASAAQTNREDYVSVTITDEREPFQPRKRLEEVYPHLLEFKTENSRTRMQLSETADIFDVSEPLKVFGQFYEEMQGRCMEEEERNMMEQVLNEAKE